MKRYEDAGVNLQAADEVVVGYKAIARATNTSGVMGGIGGFGGLFRLAGYKNPVLVSGCDGVGTKLKLAFVTGKVDTVGIDLVAMSVNDILVQGARPLFFLDYLAVGKLIPAVAEQIVAGVAAGCKMADCALLGGETAEMPGFYAQGEFDLAGFAVGVVEEDEVIDGSLVQAGDVILGLPSSGLHSNGFSLVRHLLADQKVDYQSPFEGKPLLETLLEPTRIYHDALSPLFNEVRPHALAHITGGGIPGNLVRILPDGLRAVIETSFWTKPPIFAYLQQLGPVPDDEMYRTFNMGLGMMLVVGQEQLSLVEKLLRVAGEPYAVVGTVEKGGKEVVLR